MENRGISYYYPFWGEREDALIRNLIEEKSNVFQVDSQELANTLRKNYN